MQKFLDFEDCFSAVGQNIMWNEANNQQPPKNEKKTKFQGGSIEGFFISFFFLTWEGCHTWKQSSPRIWRRGTESVKLLWKAGGTRDPTECVCATVLEIGISLQSRINSSPEETNMKSGGTQAGFLSEEQNWNGFRSTCCVAVAEVDLVSLKILWSKTPATWILLP